MKVLITYVSAGAGHRKVAEAVSDYLKNNRPDLSLKLVDGLLFSNRFFYFCYNRGYPFLVHSAVWLWGFFFWMTEFSLTRRFVRKISFIVNYFSCQKFVKYLENENFDFIISTHFLNSELAAHLKLKNKIKAKLVTVITDFGVHPFWVSQGTDKYVAASEVTKDVLLRAGIRETQIMVSGIPLSPNFIITQNRNRLADKFGILADKFTVLIMTGSFGTGPLEEIARNISPDAQVLLVCAKNKFLFDRLRKKDYQNVKVFGFVDNVQELMAVSDIMITKPGGSSIAELLVMGLVPIFITAIPGQEENNAKALAAYGVGFTPRNIKQIKKMVIDLKNDPQKLKSLKNNAMGLAKPYACQELADAIR
ncbi:MAG: glycosyltransferase [Candidatus Omnitrophota bacterium]|nr:glycosyltransferase [Candidatus Omnitrophota bacterium]